jgi:hypothetical protein
MWNPPKKAPVALDSTIARRYGLCQEKRSPSRISRSKCGRGVPSGPPFGAGTVAPCGPGSGVPSGPGSGVPFRPGSGVPFGPGSGVPFGPGSGVPFGPGSGEPFGPGSGRRIHPTDAAEIRKEKASNAMAMGAVRVWTSTPVSGGPATSAIDSLSARRLLASSSASRSTSEGT